MARKKGGIAGEDGQGGGTNLVSIRLRAAVKVRWENEKIYRKKSGEMADDRTLPVSLFEDGFCDIKNGPDKGVRKK